MDSRDNTWKNRALGPHAHGNTARQATDGVRTKARGQQKQSNDPGNNQNNLMFHRYLPPVGHFISPTYTVLTRQVLRVDDCGTRRLYLQGWRLPLVLSAYLLTGSCGVSGAHVPSQIMCIHCRMYHNHWM